MIKETVAKILKSLSEGIYEKDEAIHLAFLTAIAGESIFLLGPPGVAKSLIARRLKYAFKEGKAFEYLMSRFSTPDEIFGPISIKRLKDEDKYERIVTKYLPDANIVFLDEIWKAGPSIQNALLTILNEKIYRNGEQEIEVDIRGIIAASNEIPQLGEGLDALWDRFLVRYEIGEIRNHQNFLNMITATKDVYTDTLAEEDKISDEQVEDWSETIDQIHLTDEVLNTIQVIKYKIEEYNQKQSSPETRILIYDRRWKKIVRLLRTAAFLNGREEVNLMDCFLINHCLWQKPSQFDTILQIVSETIRKHGYSIALNLSAIKKEMKALEEEVDREVRIPHTVTVNEPQSIDNDYLEVLGITNYFEGQLIKKAEFAKLKREETQSISLFDESHSLVNKINARLSDQENTIDIYYNAQVFSLQLKTVQREKTEVTSKKPHELVEQFWDERTDKLMQFVKQQQEKLNNDRPTALAHLKENFFVPAHLSEIVEANLQESIKSLNNLQLRIEKLIHSYKNIR